MSKYLAKETERARGGALSYGLIMIAATIAVPFTSLWLLVVVGAILGIEFLALLIYNVTKGCPANHLIIKTFATVDSCNSFVGNYLRF